MEDREVVKLLRGKDAEIANLNTGMSRLKSKLDAETKRADLHADINRRAAAALGKPTTGEGSSWHDIPECITRARVGELVRVQQRFGIECVHREGHGCSCAFCYAEARIRKIKGEEE